MVVDWSDFFYGVVLGHHVELPLPVYQMLAVLCCVQIFTLSRLWHEVEHSPLNRPRLPCRLRKVRLHLFEALEKL